MVSPTLTHPDSFGLPLSIVLRKTIQNATATVEYDNIQIEAAEIAPELNANFNSTGGVDAADLAIWKANFAATSLNATHAKGNANGDDYVDGHDFVLWQRKHRRRRRCRPRARAVHDDACPGRAADSRRLRAAQP